MTAGANALVGRMSAIRRLTATTDGCPERVFSRIKGYRKLFSLRARRMPKVWPHVALSIVMNGSAMSKVLDSVGAMRGRLDSNLTIQSLTWASPVDQL